LDLVILLASLTCDEDLKLLDQRRLI